MEIGKLEEMGHSGNQRKYGNVNSEIQRTGECEIGKIRETEKIEKMGKWEIGKQKRQKQREFEKWEIGKQRKWGNGKIRGDSEN